jgi:hypothetical protein
MAKFLASEHLVKMIGISCLFYIFFIQNLMFHLKVFFMAICHLICN